VKVVILQKVKLSNLHKIGKCGKEIGKIINKIWKNRRFHIVGIDQKASLTGMLWEIYVYLNSMENFRFFYSQSG